MQSRTRRVEYFSSNKKFTISWSILLHIDGAIANWTYVPDINIYVSVIRVYIYHEILLYLTSLPWYPSTVRPELAYVLLLHFTFASGSGRAGHVGHAGCAEFFFLP